MKIKSKKLRGGGGSGPVGGSGRVGGGRCEQRSDVFVKIQKKNWGGGGGGGVGLGGGGGGGSGWL